MTGECWLEIPVPPIVEPSENVAAQIGDDVTISCRLTSGKPAPSIRWYFQGNGDEYGLWFNSNSLFKEPAKCDDKIFEVTPEILKNLCHLH